jgi:hypothetical protein
MVYNVHLMKGYKVSEARARFGDLLDEAEAGDVVFIQRHGVTFSLRAEGSPAKRAQPVSTITWAHPAVEAGQWTWEEGPDGLEFVDTRAGAQHPPRKRNKPKR